ncbi:TPA: hypothetical protein N0F65_005357 [Lagenidium giganteum]|uniref:Cytochrome P450 n=1 Tax=Lagenidium giganteum TaxID=4803 RepID=A0AAV2YNB6_9STRA|nr:TPA: hypothetical protein N0F65_005357 [Lagenidium giganteum]
MVALRLAVTAAMATVVSAFRARNAMRADAPFMGDGLGPISQCNSGVIGLQSDTGMWLSRCNGCSPDAAYPDQVTMHMDSPSEAFSQWIVRVLPDGKIGLETLDTKHFLARCNGCHAEAAYSDSEFAHVEELPSAPWAQWTVVPLGGDRIALMSDTGNFLARCNGCVGGGAVPDFAFVHAPNAEDPWTQFKVACL